MMTGISGTSQNGKLHSYYACKGVSQHKCNRKNVQRDYIENLVILKARELLTDELIKEVANAVYKTACKQQEGTRLKQLQREILNLEKQRANLFDSLKLCYDDDVKKSLFEEISKMEKQRKEFEKLIKIEKSEIFQVTENEIIDFLQSLRYGDIESLRYRQMIVNVLVHKVYLYDTHFTTVYTIQNENGEYITSDVPTINEIESYFENQESSFLDYNAEPIKYLLDF